MSLDSLFDIFLKERLFLKNVSPKTKVWYETAWKAFKASQCGNTELSKAALQAFVVHLRERGVKPVSCNTYIKALNAFCRWLHAEGHRSDALRLAPLRTEKTLVKTFADPQMKVLLTFKPHTFNEWRIFALGCSLLDTGCRVRC